MKMAASTGCHFTRFSYINYKRRISLDWGSRLVFLFFLIKEEIISYVLSYFRKAARRDWQRPPGLEMFESVLICGALLGALSNTSSAIDTMDQTSLCPPEVRETLSGVDDLFTDPRSRESAVQIVLSAYSTDSTLCCLRCLMQ